MGGRVGLLLATVTVGAAAGSGGESRTATTAHLRGEVRGVVDTTGFATGGGALYLSLHGLERGSRYQVVESSASCADQDGDSDGNDFLLWKRSFVARGTDDVFRTGRVRLQRALETAKSVFVFEVTSAGRTRVACAAIDVWEHA